MVAGSRTFQNGTRGSTVFVIKLTDFFLTCARRAKYFGLGCSSWISRLVKSHLCVISAEYLFHSSKKSVAEKKLKYFLN